MRIRSGGLGILLLAGAALSLAVDASRGAGIGAAMVNQGGDPEISQLTTAANGGDVKAMRKLGNLYLDSNVVPKDVAAALSWFQKGAQAGDVPCMSGVAIIYLNGDGVPQDMMAARHWAKQAADLNDPAGEWLYYLTVANGPELSFQVRGTPDNDLYNKLAKRSVEERALDISAYSALAKALAAGLPQARKSVVHELLDRAAPGNREAALAVMQNPEPLPDSEKMVAILAKQKALGETLTKPEMFSGVLQSAQVAARIEAKAGDDAQVRLVGLAISKPLSQAAYLPVPEAPFEHFYLLQGTWQETWTFDVGGTKVSVPIDLQADGFGGAYYQAHASVP